MTDQSATNSRPQPDLKTALQALEDPAHPVSQQLMHYAASRIYAAVERCFAHWQGVPQLAHAELYHAYLHQLPSCHTRRDFFEATQSYLAQLHNGHTAFHDHTLMTSGGFGFWARPLPESAKNPAEHWTICASTHAQLSPGDQILTVNGERAEAFFGRYTALISSSRSQAAQYSLLMGRSHLLPDTLHLTLSSSIQTTITRSASQQTPAKVPVELDRSGSTPRLIIRSFEEGCETDALQLLRPLLDAPALILDVRSNGGGNTPMELMRTLCPRGFSFWQEQTPQTSALELAQNNIALWQQGALADQHHQASLNSAAPMKTIPAETITPADQAYRGELAVLMDAGSGSATEDLLLALSQSPQATLIGETSTGSTGQPYFEQPLPHTLLAVSTKRVTFPDDQPFEGVGICPHIPIRPSAQDLRARRDVALQTAQDLCAA